MSNLSPYNIRKSIQKLSQLKWNPGYIIWVNSYQIHQSIVSIEKKRQISLESYDPLDIWFKLMNLEILCKGLTVLLSLQSDVQIRTVKFRSFERASAQKFVYKKIISNWKSFLEAIPNKRCLFRFEKFQI